MDDRLLSIYLNDHLGGAMTGRELAARCRARNAGTPLGEFLERLVTEIEKDRATLTDLIERLHLRKDPVKPVLGWANEKVMRLKPNGTIPVVGYSAMTRLQELELLSTGIEGKRLLWLSLASLAETDARLHRPELDRLVARAQRQRHELEPFRIEAARQALLERAS